MNKPTPKFLGHIRGGKIVIHNAYGYKKHLEQFKDGQAVNITIKKAIKTRTSKQFGEKSNQNGYYWAVVIPILADYLGYFHDEMHEAIKYKFLRTGGTDQLPKIKSTSKLNTVEWEKFMDDIRIWALNDYGVKIPKPNEVDNES